MIAPATVSSFVHDGASVYFVIKGTQKRCPLAFSKLNVFPRTSGRRVEWLSQARRFLVVFLLLLALAKALRRGLIPLSCRGSLQESGEGNPEGPQHECPYFGSPCWSPLTMKIQTRPPQANKTPLTVPYECPFAGTRLQVMEKGILWESHSP